MMANGTYLGAVACGASGFSIVFRDLPGCASCGSSLEEALEMGREALSGHIATMRDHGEMVPAPTGHSLDDVEAWLYDPEDTDRDAWVGLYPIAIDPAIVEPGVIVRVKADLVQRIADLAEATASKIDSRRFIEDAVEHEIERYRKSA